MEIVKFEKVENKDMVTVTVSLPGTMPATAANYEVFFIALRPYYVMEISEAHRVAGSDGSAVTLGIERLSGTEALGSGDSICVAEFSLKGTANTVVTKKGTDLQNQFINIGDRLALEDTGTLTAVAGLTVTLLLKPYNKGDYR